jgi:hypothetical protein
MLVKEKLVAASNSPMSIVFVRVDNGDHQTFSDAKLSSYLNMKCQRPAFCSCVDSKLFCSNRQPAKLAYVFLDKLKVDVPEYFESKGIRWR